MAQGLKEINEAIAKEAKGKQTVESLEDQARRMFDYHKQFHADKEKSEFYRGFLRAITLLRKHGLLKEEGS